MNVCDCGEGPDGVSESIFGYCYSQCGYAVQYSLDTRSMSVE